MLKINNTLHTGNGTEDPSPLGREAGRKVQ